MGWIAKWRALPLQWSADPLDRRRRQPNGPEPVVSVEMGGEDVTGRLLAGETVYFVPEQVDPETQQQAGWPEGWTVMGMIDGN